MITPDEAWQHVHIRATTRYRRKIDGLRSFLAKLDNPHARLLTGRVTDGALDQISAERLESWIVGEYRRSAISKFDTAIWLALVHAAIKQFAADGVTAHLTRLAAVAAPITSPFAPDAIAATERVEEWRAGLHGWIRKDAAKVSRSIWQAGIVLSAVLNGALLDTAKFKDLVQLLIESKRPDVTNCFATFSFSMLFQGLGYHHLQRWTLDPITEMLVLRLPLEGESILPARLLTSIRELLNAQGVGNKHLPLSLSDLAQSAASWWSSRAASIDVQASMRRFATHAINPITWGRMYGTKTLASGPPERISDDSNEDLADYVYDDVGLRYPWLERAINALLPSDTSGARSEILGGRPTGIERTYLGWLEAMWAGESHSGDRLAQSTILRRFSAAAPRLIALLGDADPATMETPYLEDCYGELVTDPMPGVPLLDLVNGLRDFHSFLVRHFKKKHIRNESEVFGDQAALKPVDANLITHEEYFKTLEWLGQQWKHGWSEDDIETCKLLLILAFRTGMRRMEIFGLRLSDIQVYGGLRLVVRPHIERRLKTKNSRRVIPAFALMPRSERQFIIEWVHRRRTEWTPSERHPTRSAYMFPEFEHERSLSRIDRICRLLYSGLKEVTGVDLFLHHLRHAFATWTYTALRAPDYPLLVDFLAAVPQTAEYIRQGRRLRILLLHRSGATRAIVRGEVTMVGSPSRRYAFAVARLLGHSSPLVSLGHYVHTSDLILGAIAWKECLSIDKPVLASASGLSHQVAYDQLDRSLESLVGSCRRKFAKVRTPIDTGQVSDPPQETKETRGRKRLPPASQRSGWIPFSTLYLLFELALSQQREAGEIADRLALSLGEVESILAAGNEWGANIGLPYAGDVLAGGPSPPRGDAERTFADGIEEKLARMALRAPTLFRDGVKIHLSFISRQKWDVVFRSGDVRELNRYLRFLDSLGFSMSEFQWVLRRSSADAKDLPSWAAKVRRGWFPGRTRIIAPPTDKRDSYQTWLGIHPTGVNGKGCGALLAKLMFLSCVGQRL